MAYYKNVEQIALLGENYSGISTKSDMEKRGVSLENENTIIVPNKINSIEITKYFNKSGQKEYGMGCELKCELESGQSILIYSDMMWYLSVLKTSIADKTKILGDFLILFKGVIAEIVERNSSQHLSHLDEIQKQEESNMKKSNFNCNVGDIVNIYGKSLYLGEYWYYKPNLKTENGYNKLSKYKLYLSLPSEWSYGQELDYNLTTIRVESGKTQLNQPTQILSSVPLTFLDEIKADASEHFNVMKNLGEGYVKQRYGFRDFKPMIIKNTLAFVLNFAKENKAEATTLELEELLIYAYFLNLTYDSTVYSMRERLVPPRYVKL